MNTYLTDTLDHYQLKVTPEALAILQMDSTIDVKVSAELIINQQSYKVRLSYRGAHTRNLPKKSYLVQFTDPDTYGGQKEFHLNAEFHDPSMLRNRLSFEFFQQIGVLAPTAQHVMLYINDEYQGLYLHLESVDEKFLASRSLPNGSIYYAVSGNANFSLLRPKSEEVKPTLHAGYRLKHGNDHTLEYISQLVYLINTVKRVDFEQTISEYLQVEKYLLWLIGAVCTQNFDGFIHNYAMYLPDDTKRFEMIPWDYDATWGRDCNGVMMSYDFIDAEGFNTLSARLLDVPPFKKWYKDRVLDILETTYTAKTLSPRLNHLHDKLRAAYLQDPYKKNQIHTFDAEPEYISTFIEERRKFLRRQLRSW
ncbi:CotH kinase family protein [Brevibacillus daliensis]|uniref:CotH kinase family protein n=1 Tax=Brevibacillus daliensis TaxID=2892995 RepID=UPI001E30C323|nr:CotH kinase family protein [Brevibacillus daliensis]